MPPTDPAAAPRRGTTLRTLVLGAAVVLVVVAGALLLAPGEGPGATPGGAGATGAGVAGLGGATLAQPPAEPVGQPLPEATLEGFDGGPPVTLSQYRGAPLVVNFWATWCAPCVAEMPDLQAVAHQAQGEVAFLGINYQDAPSNATSFARDLGITYDLATDADGAYLEERVRGYGMPTTLLVDPAGLIVDRHTGPLDAGELRALLREHFGLAMPEGGG